MLERKADPLVAVETAAGELNDYEVFMAMADHIGHTKRGKVTYVRDESGNEIVEEREETIKEYEGGRPVYRRQRIQSKVVDDNTLQIAQGFRTWLSERD